MKAINEYAVSIIIASLLAILLETLLPEDSNKKYTGIIIGLFVMLVMLNPLTKLPHFDRTFTIPQVKSDDAITVSASSTFVAESFEEKLAQTISEDIQNTYKTEICCRVRCSTNESGQITGIKNLTLSPHSQEVCRYISEKYGIEEAQITQ